LRENVFVSRVPNVFAIHISASAGAELRLANGVVLLAKFDGEFASHSSTYAGTGTVRYPSPLSIKNSVIQ
jgi:hypothetical protein